MDRVYLGMGYLCGAEILLLGLFITYQVIARATGMVRAPGTDLLSGFVLAMAATWRRPIPPPPLRWHRSSSTSSSSLLRPIVLW